MSENMNRDILLEITLDVLTVLEGEGWSLVDAADDDGNELPKFEHDDLNGAGFYLNEIEQRGKKRIVVTGHFPPDVELTAQERKGITIAASKGGAAIAGEIKARFLTAYLPLYDGKTREMEVQASQEEEYLRIITNFANQTEGTVSDDGDRVDFDLGHVSGTLRLVDGRATVELQGLEVSLAQAFITFIGMVS